MFGKIPDFELERYFAKHEFSAKHLLCSSDAETTSIGELLALEKGAERKFLDLRMGYTESLGSPRLREEIAGLYETIRPEEVIITSGAQESIFLLANAALKQNGSVVVETPCYQSLYEMPASLGCRVEKWALMQKDGKWNAGMEKLAGFGKMDALVLNSPHNPTGHQFGRGEFEEIAGIAERKSAMLISDEVYRFLEYDEKDRLPAACDIYERAVSIGVMSKAFGLAGLRIGWIATKDAALRKRFASLKDYTTICNSAPSEFLAEVALRNRKDVIGRIMGIIRRNLALLDGFFSRHAGRFAYEQPRAGTVAFPEIRAGDAKKFCSMALEQKGVLLVPSGKFNFGNRNFRVGYGRNSMPEALEALEECLV